MLKGILEFMQAGCTDQIDRQVKVSGFCDFTAPLCMECRRGLAMRILSVRLSNACFVTKW